MERLAELIGWELEGKNGRENLEVYNRIMEHLKQQQINADREKMLREVSDGQ